MRTLLSVAALTLFIAQFAQANELLCASKKGQPLYYSTGQIRLTAEIANAAHLTNVSLSTTGSDQLGSHELEAQGKIQGKYVRFEIGGDAWCSYRLTLPKRFMTEESPPAFVDAYCEENANSSIRLYCTVQNTK